MKYSRFPSECLPHVHHQHLSEAHDQQGAAGRAPLRALPAQQGPGGLPQHVLQQAAGAAARLGDEARPHWQGGQKPGRQSESL